MGPVRMISSGHELTTDYDEKTLHELGFKDMQVTFCFISFLMLLGFFFLVLLLEQEMQKLLLTAVEQLL